MTAVGVDTHKASLAACAVDNGGAALADMTFANHRAGHTALATWAATLDPAAIIGIEGSATYGASLARFLLDARQAVREVPPHLTRRERIRTRRPGKSDPGDALAIARVMLREPTLPPVRRADAARELQLLVEAREDLMAEATRTRNRLHADLLVLLRAAAARWSGRVRCPPWPAGCDAAPVFRPSWPATGCALCAGCAPRRVGSSSGSANGSPVIHCLRSPASAP